MNTSHQFEENCKTVERFSFKKSLVQWKLWISHITQLKPWDCKSILCLERKNNGCPYHPVMGSFACIQCFLEILDYPQRNLNYPHITISCVLKERGNYCPYHPVMGSNIIKRHLSPESMRTTKRKSLQRKDETH